MSFDAHTLRDALRTDLMSAMKSRDTDAVAALRTAIAAIDNAESVDTTGLTDTEVPRRVLTATDVRDILAGHVRDYLADADGYDAVAQRAAAQQLRRQADVVGRYLHEDAT